MTRSHATRAPIAGTLVTLGLLVATPLCAQSIADHQRVREALHLLDLWVDARQAYENIPGASIAIVHDQETLFANGYGYAHVASETPATPSTMYSICSISKLFTSIGMLQQRDAGKLRLSDRVTDHLDWFDLLQTYPEAGPVTIEGLLTHSSGLPREADAPYWTGPDHPFPTREEIIDRVSNQEMLYPTQTHYQYSNLGLTLAGEIVSERSGRRWDEYVEGEILEPLGMKHTSTDHHEPLRGGRLATGYSAIQRDGSRLVVPPYQVRGIGPAAGMLSTVEDLARFAAWQFRTLDGHDDILARNTLREMQRVHFMQPDGSSTYGLGFSVWQDGGKTFVGHGGSCPGYESHLLLRPQEKFASTFMTNGRRVSARSFTQRAYDIVAPAVRAAVSGEASKAPDPDLVALTGLYKRPLGTETAVLLWEGDLVTVGLPTSNPIGGMTKLRHIEGNTFRRIRSDGDLGEAFVFQEDEDGHMRLWRNNNYSIRLPEG